ALRLSLHPGPRARGGRDAGGLSARLSLSFFVPWRRQVHELAVPHRSQLRDGRPPRPPGPGDPDARLELRTALESVSEEHREPFLLIEVFGLSYREAADVLNVRVGTVKSRMHRARKAMMRALEVEEDAGGL